MQIITKIYLIFITLHPIPCFFCKFPFSLDAAVSHNKVRMYGNFRLLTDKIRGYLEAETPGDLFAKILERLEQDFETGLHTRFVFRV